MFYLYRDLWYEIYLRLDIVSIGNLSQTCSRLHETSMTESLWIEMLKCLFLIPREIIQPDVPRALFIKLHLLARWFKSNDINLADFQRTERLLMLIVLKTVHEHQPYLESVINDYDSKYQLRHSLYCIGEIIRNHRETPQIYELSVRELNLQMIGLDFGNPSEYGLRLPISYFRLSMNVGFLRFFHLSEEVLKELDITLLIDFACRIFFEISAALQESEVEMTEIMWMMFMAAFPLHRIRFPLFRQANQWWCDNKGIVKQGAETQQIHSPLLTC